jgi:hypothetical protein
MMDENEKQLVEQLGADTEEIGETEALGRVCKQYKGTHYTDPTWQRILKAVEWTNHYPVVDSDGRLTGEVLDMTSSDADDYTVIGHQEAVRPREDDD